MRFAGKNEILVFPTFTSNLVFVQSEKEITAELINVQGQLLQQIVVKGTIAINLTALPAGTYLIRVGEEKRSFKIVKQ